LTTLLLGHALDKFGDLNRAAHRIIRHPLVS
jgi:hypothetical protein